MASDEYDPFERAISAFNQVNRWMDRVLAGQRPPGMTSEGQWEPPTDVYETQEGIVVCMDLAGVDPATIEVKFTQPLLSVSGYRAVTRGAGRCHRAEIEHGRFFRRVTIPIDIEEDEVQATSRHGLLEIHLPRRKEVGPKKISISDESEQSR